MAATVYKLLLWKSERAVCEVCNSKRQRSTPWRLHSYSPPAPKVQHWPTYSCPGLPRGCSSLPFPAPHTTHSPGRCEDVYGTAVLSVFTRVPASMSVIVVLCMLCAYICLFCKRQQRAECWWGWVWGQGVCTRDKVNKKEHRKRRRVSEELTVSRENLMLVKV